MNTLAPADKPAAKNRRSQRLLLQFPITVQDMEETGAPPETTQTQVVNAHGALLLTAREEKKGQTLLLKCGKCGETQMCMVVFVGNRVNGAYQVGVEFVKPAPKFWHVNFPPEDWEHTPEAKLPAER